MRVIAGEFRSRKLRSVAGVEVRPTPDRLRETLFNVIAAEVPGAVFVDCYAGVGAVGIEALSRGAMRCVFIEKARTAVEAIESNLQSLDIMGRARVIRGSVKTYLENQQADIFFLDPPYDMEAEYRASLEILGRKPMKLAIAQHDRRTVLAVEFGSLRRTREIRQGDNLLSFYRPITE